MFTHPYSNISSTGGVETETSQYTGLSKPQYTKNDAKLHNEELNHPDYKKNKLENGPPEKTESKLKDENYKEPNLFNEATLKTTIEEYLTAITKPSDNKPLFYAKINEFFSSNKTLKHLYNKDYPLINRLHLLTKIDSLKFKLEEIFSQLKEAITKAERDNLQYLTDSHQPRSIKEYKNRDAINISYFLNVLHDDNKIKTEDFCVIKSFQKSVMKERMWKEGEKLFSDFKFRSVKQSQRGKWLEGRQAGETEMMDLYKKGVCNVSLPIYNLISLHYMEVQERILNNPTEVHHMGCNLLIIDFEEFLKALNEYENFQDVLMNTLHSLLDFENQTKIKQKEINKEIVNIFKNSKFVVKLKDLCYFLIKLQQIFIIKIDVHSEFIKCLIEFLKNEFCIKANIQRGEDIEEEGISVPSSVISIDDFFDILYIRLSIINL